MRVRHSTEQTDEKITLQMTPMIDIVFQLLIFFIMTFKIVAQEGDFNIRMPLALKREGPVDPTTTLTMRLRLRSDADGKLAGVSLGEQPIESFEGLRYRMIDMVGGDDPSVRQDAEVELDCDYNLHYEYVVEAITAVSGYIDETTGQVVKLVEKIKFTPPKAPAE